MKKLSRLLLVTGAAALLAAGVKAYSTLRRTAEAEAALVQTRERLRELQALSQLVDRYGDQKRVIEEKLHLIETLQGDPVIPDRLVEHLEESAPGGLQLERILVQSEVVEISGRAASRAVLTGWGHSLEEQGVLEELDLRQFEAAPAGVGGKFVLAGRLAPPRAAAEEDAASDAPGAALPGEDGE